MANIIVPISCGRAIINVPFKDGCLDKKQSRPATYSTGDPVMQAIIENSAQFGHRIFLRDTFGIPDAPEAPVTPKPVAAPVAVEPEEEAAPEAQEYPEVTTFEEAIAVLKGLPGVKATQLRTPASAKKIAAMNAVSFPNYNFE